MAALIKALFCVCAATSMFGQISSTQLEKHAEAAQEAQARQDYKTAIAEYEILSRSMPQSAELMSNLGVAYYFDHQLTKASSVFRKAIALSPGLEAPHLFLGLAMYRFSDPDNAVKELGEAVHLNPADALAHTWLGYAYVAQSHYDIALTEFQKTVQLQPENVDAWYALGQTYLEIGREKTQQLLQAAPNGGRVWQLVGDQFEMDGDHEKAAAAFAEAHRRRPDISAASATASAGDNGNTEEDTLYRQARDAEQGAKDAFQRVLQHSPDSARSHQIAADAYFAQQQFDTALAEYRLVLAADPALPGIHLQISNSLMIKGQFAQALEECREEEKLQPRSAKVKAALGRILLAMGNDTEAATVLKQSLDLDRPPIEAYLLLAKADLKSHNESAAIRLLQHYVASKPDDSNGYYLLSRAYRMTGDREQMEQALALYQKTSRDVKERSLAQTELSRLNNEGSSISMSEVEDGGANVPIHP